MTFQYRYRKQILISVIVLIIITSLIVLYFYKKPKKKVKKEPEITIAKIEKKEKKESVEMVQIDIKGQVLTPGLYSLDKESRIMDAIMVAGGLTEQADTSVINLSKKVTDEMVIIIYSKEEVADFKKTKEQEQSLQQMCIQKDENALKNDACITTENTPIGKISINNATIEELMTLPGIGEAKAKEIVNYRETNGPFQDINDLMNVPGIGESLFVKIQEDITL